MKRSFALALISLAAFAGDALAQAATERAPGQPSTTPAQPGATTRTQPGATTSAQPGAGTLDQQVAVCLTLGNKAEAALAQYAQGRTQNPEVKKFAQMIAQEHQKAVAKLQQAAPEVANFNLEIKGAEGAGSVSAAPAAQPGASATAAAGAQPSGTPRTAAYRAQAGDQQMIEFAREVKQECLNLTQTELGKKQGAEFDKCFIGQQIMAHTGMLAELRVAQRHVSSQLQPVIKEGIQMTEQHLAQAKSIAEQLESASGREQARLPGATEQPRRQ